jgi:hypothetical protein
MLSLLQASFLQTKVCQISGRSLCDGLGTTWVMEDELWDTVTDINMGMDESTLSLVREKAVDLVQATLLIRTNPLHGSAPGYLQCCIYVYFWVMLYGIRSCW